MEKLELKHLAGYLPYGLKIDATYYNEEYKNEEISGITKDDVIVDYGKSSTYGKRITQEYCIEHIKPILRPLSDLTKEIEVNGEKFVPMEEMIVKAIDDYDNGEECFSSEHIEEFNLHIGLCVRAILGEGNEFFIRYYKDKRTFSLFTPQKLDVHLSYEYLEKLYKWHFDIHGLIDKGLAIDINTL